MAEIARDKNLYSSITARVLLDIFSRGSFIVVTIFIARVLGVREFGKFGYAISIAHIFYTFTDLGTNLQLLKELGEQRGRNEAIWKNYLEFKLCLMVFCLVLFGATALVVKWENTTILFLALIWMFGNSFLDFNQFICNGLGRMDLARGQMLLQRGLMILFVVVSLLFYSTLGGILTALAAGAIVGSLLSNYYFFRKLKLVFSFTWDFREWKRIFWVSLPNAIAGAFGGWYLRAGVVILAWEWSHHVVGEYVAAFRIYETSYILPAAIMAITLPHLSSALSLERSLFLSKLKRVSYVILPCAFAWAGFLIFGSPLIIKILYGESFAGAVPILRYLGFVSAFVFLNYLVTHLMIVINCQRRHAVHEVLAFLLCLTLCFTFIGRQGAQGAAMALLLTEISLFIVTISFLIFKYVNSDRHRGLTVPPKVEIS